LENALTRSFETVGMLQESEEKLRLVVTNMPDVAWMSDRGGGTVYISPRVAEVLGFTVEEVCRSGNTLWFGRIHPEDLERVKASYDAMFTSGSGLDIEYRIRHKLGHWVWLHNRASVPSAKEGKRYAHGVFRDVTAQKTGIVSVPQREEPFSVQAENLPGILYRLEIKQGNKIRLFSRKTIEQLTGYSREDLAAAKTHPLEHIMLPSDRERVMAELSRSVSEAIPSSIEYGIRHQNGTIRHFLEIGAVARDPDGDPAYLDGIIFDITDRKKVEQHLRASEEKYRDLFDNAMDAIFIVDADARYIDVNKKAVELFGYSLEEFRSMRIHDVIPPDQVERTEEELRALKEQGGYEKFRGKIRTKDGRWLDIEVSSSAIVEEGRVIGSRDIVRDITGQVQAELKLAASEHILRQLIDNAPFGAHLYELNDDGRLVFTGANRAADTILGLDNREFIGKAIEEAFPALKDTEIPSAYRAVAEQGTPYEKELFEYQDEKVRGTFEIVTANLGKNRMAAFFRDITARRKAEEDLRIKDAALATSLNAVAFADLTGMLTYVNGSFLKLWGYERADEVTGRPAVEFWEDPESAREIIAALLAQGVWDGQLNARKKDGSVFTAQLTASRVTDREGKPLCLMSSFLDITERRKAEEALRAEKNRSEAIIAAIGDGISIQDRDFRIIYQNEVHKSLAGDHAGELCYRAYEHQEQVCDSCPVARTFLDGKIHSEERSIVRDGERIHVDITTSPLRDAEGNIIAGIEAVRDITARKLSEEVLRSTEQRLRDIVEHSTNLFYAHGPDHVLTFVSPQARHFFQCEPEQALVRWTDFLTENPQNDRGIELTQRAIDSGLPQAPYECEIRGKKGQILWVEVNEAPVVRDGRTVSVVGSLTDVTRRKRAEEDERRSRKQLQLLINRMPIGCIMWDPSFRVVLWNPAAERIFGYSAAEAIGKHAYLLIVPPSVRSMVESVWERLLVGDQTAHSVNGNATRDGRTIVCEWYNTPIRDASGKVAWVLSMVQDVTERRQAEEQLKRNEEKYRSIFDNASVSLWEEDFSGVKAALDEIKGRGIYDFRAYFREHPDETLRIGALTHIVDVNKMTLRLYGARSKDEFVRSLSQVLTPEAGVVLQDLLAAIAEGRTWFEAATTNRTLNGKVLNILMTVSIPSPTSSFRNCLVSIMDITERKRADEERKRLEAQLLQSQKIEAIGLLAGGVAHDFNNILSAIMGYASILQMKMRQDDPLRSHVEQVLMASKRAAGLTQSLLAFSRKQIINPKPLLVNDSIRKIEKMLRRIIGEDVEFVTSYAPVDQTVMIDPGQLEQVIINLATNARDAMPNGGILSIETGKTSMDEKFVRLHGFGKIGPYVLITVSDTGTGMDEQTKSRIFEPFFTTKELGKGTGLGLSMVYGIVKQNHGFIVCSSEPGRGTTFHVYFPPVAIQPPAKAVAAPLPVKGGLETILIAEDDDTMRSLFESVFTDQGYRVITAADGEEAIVKFRKNAADVKLLLLDVIMPKKNGKEVFDVARKITPGIKSLFISGYTADIVHRKGILDEGINFITKPVVPADLLRKVRQILDQKP
jgi:PAS domain S-box-containing protein